MAATTGDRRMRVVRRRYLISLSFMGALVCALGSTGLFAALTDSARTGTNTVNTGALPGAADLQISNANVVPPPPENPSLPSLVGCDVFQEDLTTAGFAVSDAEPGVVIGQHWYCLRNVGSQTVNVTATIDSLSDVDLLCTGDEELYNDLTCGNQLEGELSSVLDVTYRKPFLCQNLALGTTEGTIGMAENVNQSGPPIILPAGDVACISMEIGYSTTTPNDEVQRAQSDSASWRFKFTGVAQP